MGKLRNVGVTVTLALPSGVLRAEAKSKEVKQTKRVALMETRSS